MEKKTVIIDSKTKSALKGQAHHLKPVVQIGKKGLNEAVIEEIDRALLAHELIKVQLHPDLKNTSEEVIQDITLKTSCSLIDTIGNIVIFYRQNEED